MLGKALSVQTLNHDGQTTSQSTAVYTKATGFGHKRYGILSDSDGGQESYGLWTRARYSTNGNTGIYTFAQGSGNNSTARGIWAKVGPANVAYAIQADASTSSAPTAYAGYFIGDVECTSGCGSGPSEDNLKENIVDIDRAMVLEKLMQLNPKTYTYKQDGLYEFMKLKTGTRHGLIAQDVEKIFPTFVKDVIHPAAIDEEGQEIREAFSYKSMDYSELIPLLLTAIQEQQVEIDAFKSALSARGIEVNR